MKPHISGRISIMLKLFPDMSIVWKNIGFQDKCYRKTDWTHQKKKKNSSKFSSQEKKYTTLYEDRW